MEEKDYLLVVPLYVALISYLLLTLTIQLLGRIKTRFRRFQTGKGRVRSKELGGN